jgi:hypothetical protein
LSSCGMDEVNCRKLRFKIEIKDKSLFVYWFGKE